MSYKHDSEVVLLSRYGLASSAAKAELFETYDRLRDLTVSGPALGGSGLGKFSSLLVNVAKMFGAAPFQPTFGNEAITVPGTSYYSPITGGTGIQPGGQAAFGLAPFSQITGIPTGGAAPLFGNATPLQRLSSFGIGRFNAGFFAGGAASLNTTSTALTDIGGIGGVIAGGASGIAQAATVGAATTGGASGAGFGRNWVMPAAGVVSGIGGLLTTLGPFFGPFGIAAAAGGSVLNGVSGAVLSSFQNVSNRILVNADTILANKIKNLETTVKQLDAQQAILKKLLKEKVDGDKKALDNI
ncbi:MAG: hypothetical protein AAGI66_07740 [Cyanobacteria bacterium P01_H01_bin.74]